MLPQHTSELVDFATSCSPSLGQTGIPRCSSLNNIGVGISTLMLHYT